MPITTKFQCIGLCKKEFTLNDWECTPGVRHEVEPRTFYMLDAPSLSEKDKMGKAFRSSRTTVLNVPPERNVKNENGELTRIPGGYVIFNRGMYVTNDPEIIFWLEKYGHDKITKERWLEVYFSPLEKQQLKDIELSNRERETNRKLAEVNELLAAAKAQTSKVKSA